MNGDGRQDELRIASDGPVAALYGCLSQERRAVEITSFPSDMKSELIRDAFPAWAAVKANVSDYFPNLDKTGQKLFLSIPETDHILVIYWDKREQQFAVVAPCPDCQ